MEERRELQRRVVQLAAQLSERVKATHRALQVDHNRLELDWLRQDISLLSHSVNRRQAFLTSVRDRARNDNEMVRLIERRAMASRESLRMQREREQTLHTQSVQLQSDAANSGADLPQRPHTSTEAGPGRALHDGPRLASDPSRHAAEGILEGILRSTLIRQEAEARTVLRLQHFPIEIMEATTQILPASKKAGKHKDGCCAGDSESMVSMEGNCSLFCRCEVEVPPPAKEALAGNHSEEEVEEEVEEEEECAVCLSVMVGGERVIRLRCGHGYHWACLKPWSVPCPSGG